MTLLRLPADLKTEPVLWSVGSSNKCEAVLLPGEAILSESLECPDSLKSERQLTQWLLANPEVCQWDPETEIIVSIGKREGRCYYWAANRELWEHWTHILVGEYKRLPLLPDWMLLPEPKDSELYGLRVANLVIYRNEADNGGALSEEMAHLVDALQPRWFGLPNGQEFYRLSVSYLRRQIKKAGHKKLSLPFIIPGVQKSLLTLTIMVGAFLVSQTGEYIWLTATRAKTVPTVNNAEPATAPQELLRSLERLHQIQQLGPVMLEKLNLQPGSIEYIMNSPLPCEVIKERLSGQPLTSVFQTRQSGCHITLQGKST